MYITHTFSHPFPLHTVPFFSPNNPSTFLFIIVSVREGRGERERDTKKMEPRVLYMLHKCFTDERDLQTSFYF